MRPYVLLSLFGEFLESGHDSAVLHRTIELSPRLAHQVPSDALARVTLEIRRRSIGLASKGDRTRIGSVG